MIFLTPMVKNATKALTNNNFKKLSLAVGLSCALFSQQALALTLSSDIQQKSVHIFQPLDLKIEIIDRDNEVESSDIFINMASQRTFERLGLDRNFFLSKLDLNVEETESGVKYVHITSQDLVKEPFLMLLIEVTWPNGHLFKDYTILFDAPLTQKRVESTPIMLSKPQIKIVPNNEVIDTIEYNEPTIKVMDRPDPIAQSNSSSYLVKKTDTLWEVAVKTKPNQDVSVQQMMISIQDKNPEAFVNNNINILKAGANLDIPTAQEATSIAKNEANIEFYKRSQPKQTAVAVEETVEEIFSQPEIIEVEESEPVIENELDSASESETEEVKDESRPQLRLVTSDDGLLDSNSASGNQDAVIDSLENDLAIALDQVEKEQRDNAEKISTISELEEQNDTLNRIIDLKSQELAELQRQLDDQDSLEDTPVVESIDVQEGVSSETEDLAEVEELIEFLEVDDTAVTDSEAAETDLPKIEDAVVVEENVIEQAVDDSELSSQGFSSYIDKIKNWLTASPINMAITGVAGLLILALLGLLVSRNKKKDEELEEFTETDSLNLENDLDDDLLSDIDLDGDDFSGFDNAEVEEVDALEEAQKAIGYGDLNQAITILETGYQTNNNREDIIVKLLDLYGQTEQNDKFADLEARASVNAPSSLISQIKVLSNQYSTEDLSGVSDDLSEIDDVLSNLDDDIDLDFDIEEPSIEESSDEEIVSSESDDDLLDLDSTSLDEISEELDDSFDIELDSFSTDSESSNVTVSNDEIDLESIEEDLEITLDEDFEISLEEDDSSNELELNIDESPAEEISMDVLDDIDSELEILDEDDTGLDEIELEVDVQSEKADDKSPDFEFSLDELDSEIAELDAQFSTETQSVEQNEALEDDAPSMTASDVESDAELEDNIESEIDFLGDQDENTTKLNLAKAFVEMGDNDSAKEMLEEIIEEGSEEQKVEAKQMIESL